LRKLWKSLPRRFAALFQTVRDGLCSGASNFATYRAELRRAQARRLAFVPHLAITLKDLFLLEELPTWLKDEAVGRSATVAPAAAAVPAGEEHQGSEASEDATDQTKQLGPQQASPPLLNWAKYARQFVEMHNSVFVAQNLAPLYASMQILRESGEIATAAAEAAAMAAAAGGGDNNKSRSDSPATPTGQASSSVLRPPLAPSDPAVRFAILQALQRILPEEQLYALSYRCEAKKHPGGNK
jgi:hypothetical protein